MLKTSWNQEAMPKLTKRIIDALKPPTDGREASIWDTELKGLGVRQLPSGVSTYILKYRNKEGRQRKLVLARVGTTTPEEVREVARQHLAAIANGADPSGQREAVRASIIVSELCDLYLEDAAERIKPSTLAMDRSRIASHVKPLLGARKVAALTTADLERFQRDIAAGKSAQPRKGTRGGVTKGGRGVASRTLGMLGTIMEFAVRRNVITINPTRRVIRFKEGKQERFLSQVELGSLGRSMAQIEAECGSHIGVAAIRFLLMTGVRRMEALALPLASVDADASCLRLVESKRARGIAGGSRIEMRAIGAAALRELEAIERPNGCRWAFPGYVDGKHFVGLPKFFDLVCARAGLDGVTIHVLRHSFSSLAKEAGYSEFVIAGLLGHSPGGMTARYGGVPDPALVNAANHVAEEMHKRLIGEAHGPALYRRPKTSEGQ